MAQASLLAWPPDPPAPLSTAAGGGQQHRDTLGTVLPMGFLGMLPAPAIVVGRKKRDTSSPRAGHGHGCCPGSRGHCIPPMGLCPLSPSVCPGAARPCMTGNEAPSQPHPASPIAQHMWLGARRSQAGSFASPGCAGKPWGCLLPAPTFGDGCPSHAIHPPRSLPLSCCAASLLPRVGQ